MHQIQIPYLDFRGSASNGKGERGKSEKRERSKEGKKKEKRGYENGIKRETSPLPQFTFWLRHCCSVMCVFAMQLLFCGGVGAWAWGYTVVRGYSERTSLVTAAVKYVLITDGLICKFKKIIKNVFFIFMKTCRTYIITLNYI